MRQFVEIVEDFYTLYEKITEDIEDAYLIKVKCIVCSSGGFIDFQKPIIKDGFLIIGDVKYPSYLIEEITIRFRGAMIGKYEMKYRVQSSVLKKLLNEDVQVELDKHKLI